MLLRCALSLNVQYRQTVSAGIAHGPLCPTISCERVAATDVSDAKILGVSDMGFGIEIGPPHDLYPGRL